MAKKKKKSKTNPSGSDQFQTPINKRIGKRSGEEVGFSLSGAAIKIEVLFLFCICLLFIFSLWIIKGGSERILIDESFRGKESKFSLHLPSLESLFLSPSQGG